MKALKQRIRESTKGDEGFTLIELLVVIVIIGILAAVVVFSVSGITDRGATNAKKTDAATLSSAEEAYFASLPTNAGHYATEAELVSAHFLQAESCYNDITVTGTTPNYTAYAIVDDATGCTP